MGKVSLSQGMRSGPAIGAARDEFENPQQTNQHDG